MTKKVSRDCVEYFQGADAWGRNSPKSANPFSESEGDSRFNRWNLGWQEACDAAAPVKPVRTIDLTPTWSAILPVLIAAVRDGTHTGRTIACEELARMAEIADRHVAAQKAAGE